MIFISIYSDIANRIIEKLEVCERENKKFYWCRPFAYGMNNYPVSYGGNEYHGINRLLLDKGGEYLTINKIAQESLNLKDEYRIRKGSKGNMVVYFNKTPKLTPDGEIEKDKHGNPIFNCCLKKYYVYDRQDVVNKDGDNLPSKCNIEQFTHDEIIEKQKEGYNAFMQMLKNYMKATNLKIELINMGTSAYYDYNTHTIRVPKKENFKSLYEFLDTLAHETIHSTMDYFSRYNTSNKGEDEALKSYSKEELIACIGSEMLLASEPFQIIDDRTENLDNQTAYLQGWSSYLSDNKGQELVSAASKAEKATEYLLSFLCKEKNLTNEKNYAENNLNNER